MMWWCICCKDLLKRICSVNTSFNYHMITHISFQNISRAIIWWEVHHRRECKCQKKHIFASKEIFGKFITTLKFILRLFSWVICCVNPYVKFVKLQNIISSFIMVVITRQEQQRTYIKVYEWFININERCWLTS